MPNDAKLGLVIGVSMVIAVAAIFFRRDPEPGQPAALEDKSASTGANTTPVPPAPARKKSRGVPAKKTARTVGDSDSKLHTVQEGDTLFTLAQHYYGDGDKFVDIYRANKDVLKTPDQLPTGTALVIPDLTENEEAVSDDNP
jgi:nucleoid-associated protein YgaU